MAFYNYYQTQAPGLWGTSQYHFGVPPVPGYHPQPSWSGWDYYNAHAQTPDSTLFDYVWNRVKSYVTGGTSRSEAKHWHRRVYGGMTPITTLQPEEIGAAAGYEVMRMWDHHRDIYRYPLSDDHDRELEAISGLAIAEASRLWQYVMRPADTYGLREACEVAASTAQRIYNRRYDHHDPYEGYDSYSHGSRHRLGSGSDYEDYEDRRYRHRRGSGSYYPGSYAGSAYGGSSYGGSSAIAIPGTLYPPQTGYPMGTSAPSAYGGYVAPGTYGYGPQTAPFPMQGGASMMPGSYGRHRTLSGSHMYPYY